MKAVDWHTWKLKCDEAFGQCYEDITHEVSVDLIYTKICETLLNKAEEVIPKKKICIHSRGWWNEKVGKDVKSS